MRVRVKNVRQLSRVADALTRNARSKSVLRVARRGITDEMDPIKRDQRANLATEMPHRGGLAASLAGESRMTVRSTFAGSSVKVTLIDSWPGHDMKAVEKGLIRHPTFLRRLSLFSSNPLAGAQRVGGRLGEWHTQRVPAETLSSPVLAHRGGIRRNITRGLDELATRIARET